MPRTGHIALHTAAGSRTEEPTLFKYTTPVTEKPKTIVRLCRTDLLYSSVQVLKEGGENNLHYHAGVDIAWMVLKGRVRFYGPGDVVIGGKKLKPREVEKLLSDRMAVIAVGDIDPEKMERLVRAAFRDIAPRMTIAGGKIAWNTLDKAESGPV